MSNMLTQEEINALLGTGYDEKEEEQNEQEYQEGVRNLMRRLYLLDTTEERLAALKEAQENGEPITEYLIDQVKAYLNITLNIDGDLERI